jgi:hypothetical protein
MKKAINAPAAAVVALGPISLFVFTTLFVAPPANACEGGPAAVRLCELACSMGGQSAECPASGAQPAGPPQQVPAAPAAQPPPPAVAPPPPPPAAPPPAAPPPAGAPGPGTDGDAAKCIAGSAYAAQYNFFCADVGIRPAP